VSFNSKYGLIVSKAQEVALLTHGLTSGEALKKLMANLRKSEVQTQKKEGYEGTNS
jgi:uncharacterized protein YoaH (UPF0181 family)